MFFFYVQTTIFNENETQTSKREGKRDMQRLNGTNLEPYKELLELAMHDAMVRAIIPMPSELKNSVMLRSQPSFPDNYGMQILVTKFIVIEEDTYHYLSLL